MDYAFKIRYALHTQIVQFEWRGHRVMRCTAAFKDSHPKQMQSLREQIKVGAKHLFLKNEYGVHVLMFETENARMDFIREYDNQYFIFL